MYSKYAPAVRSDFNNLVDKEFGYNADGEVPGSYGLEGDYNERKTFANYDKNGFDCYGYSAKDKTGNFVGVGNGVDVHGNTEADYENDEELYMSYMPSV